MMMRATIAKNITKGIAVSDESQVSCNVQKLLWQHSDKQSELMKQD